MEFILLLFQFTKFTNRLSQILQFCQDRTGSSLEVMMRKTGMLICTNPNKFVKFIPQIRKGIDTTLYIQFMHKNQLPLVDNYDAPLPLPRGPKLSSVVQQLYKNGVCLNMDIQVLLGGIVGMSTLFKIPTKKVVEVVYFDVDLNMELMQGFIRNRLVNCAPYCQPVALVDDNSCEEATEAEKVEGDSSANNQVEDEACNNVALGGTFDRLHTGHKMLLSEAALMSKKRLLIGLTDVEMLKTKTLWELIEPYDKRENQLRAFLEDIQPGLEIEIVPLNDIYGPTKDDPTLEMLVVSQETLRGGEKVNELREKNGLKPLSIRKIQLIKEEFRCWNVEEEKISSSNGRLRLLGTLLKKPEKKPYLPDLPYVIGLTGGIASGKTSISKRLACYNMAVIDADKVAHSIYEKSQPGYASIIDHFGEKIVDPQTKEIDRRKLGSIVFSDKSKLDTLNQILWPLVLQKCHELVAKAASENYKVVVIEASLLIEAGWDKHCHETWACLVPVSEAIKRVQERNKLSSEEAAARVSSQISNSDRVAKANVVLCTLWPPEYTDLQVNRAWEELQNRLPVNS